MGCYMTLHLEETESMKSLNDDEIFFKIGDALEEMGIRAEGLIATTPFVSRNFKSMNKASEIHGEKVKSFKW